MRQKRDEIHDKKNKKFLKEREEEYLLQFPEML